jgi:hypothetical protein
MVHGILYSLAPLVEKARSPAMATVVSDIGLALLAAFGLENLLEERAASLRRNLERGAFVFAGILALFFYGYFLFRTDQWESGVGGMLTCFFAVLFGACLAAWRSGWWGARAARCSLAALVFLELGNGYVTFLSQKVDGYPLLKPLGNSKPLMDQYARLGPLSRVEMRLGDVPHNIGDWAGMEVWQGYLAGMSRNLYEAGPSEERIRLLYGVGYFAGKAPSGPWNKEVAVIGNDFRLYQNPSAFPRSWVVHETEGVESREKVLAWIRKPGIDWRKKTVVLGEAPALENCSAPEHSYVLRRVSDEVSLHVELACRGLVILADTYYPGWEVSVDGKQARLHEAYGCIRGVVVDRGVHSVVMKYRPWSVYLGFAFTLAGLIGGFGLWRLDGTNKL